MDIEDTMYTESDNSKTTLQSATGCTSGTGPVYAATTVTILKAPVQNIDFEFNKFD